jgi:hypothetical protein
MATRKRQCDKRIAAGRLRKAEQFLNTSEMLRDDLLSLPWLFRSRRGSQPGDRGTAKTGPRGKSLSNDLRALLQMKNRAEYEARPVNADQRKRAWRRAESLVEAAREL